MRSAGYVDEESLDRHAAAWLEEIREAVAPRPHLRLDPDRSALVVVDMNRYFAHPRGRCYLPAAGAIAPRVRALADAYRDRGGCVVFTRHGHEGDHDLGTLGRFFGDRISAREDDAELLDELGVRDDEPVIAKTTYDAFLRTPLEPILRDRGIEQVLVAGVLTHMCCETTARAAFCRGFEVYLPVDALATTTEALHTGALRGMADALAVATTSREVIERCARSR